MVASSLLTLVFLSDIDILYNRAYMVSPVMRSLISHRRRASCSSRAMRAAGFIRQSAKYFPLTPSRSSLSAQYSDVCAPSSDDYTKQITHCTVYSLWICILLRIYSYDYSIRSQWKENGETCEMQSMLITSSDPAWCDALMIIK